MPGLVGVVGANRDAGALLATMCKAMQSKERYKIDCFVDEPGAGLGRVHLGIFCPDEQPAGNHDGSLVAFMDGELYNRDQLAGSLGIMGVQGKKADDCQLALLTYERWGEVFASKLEGSFVVAIWDKRLRKLVVANDRFGLRPIYYALMGNKLLIGAECKAIIADPSFKRRVNDAALADLFAFGYLLGRKTMFEGINALPPASLMEFQESHLKVNSYWFPTGYLSLTNGKVKGSETQFLEEARALFNEAVEKRTKGNHKLGLPLSGGMDTRAILSAIRDDLDIACINFFGIKSATDVWLAQRVAQAAGRELYSCDFGPDILRDWSHESVRISEGMLPANQCHGIAAVDCLKRHADVVISGWGGEFPRGAMYEDRTARGIPKIPFEWNDHKAMETQVFNFDNRVFKPDEQALLFSPGYYARIKGLAQASFLEAVKPTREFPSAWDRLQHFFMWERSHRWNIFGLTFINSQLEWRAPFADYELIDAFTRMPLSLHSKAPFSMVHRYIISRNRRELGKLPEAVTGLPLESGLVRLRLNGLMNKLMSRRPLARLKLPRYAFSYYVDYNESIRNRLGDFVRGLVLDKRTLERGCFNGEYVQELFDSHMSGKRSLADQLGVMMTLELWHREFVDKT